MAGEITIREFKKFSDHFKDFSEQYVLIGGSATYLHMEDAGLPFRSTKDLDLVLCVEALNQGFVEHFWQFVKLGGYSIINKSSGENCFYRFTKPSEAGYPFMLEILSDKANIIGDREPGRIVPMTIEEEVISLSAILLNKVYYDFIMGRKVTLQGITLVDYHVIIPLKARAYLDLKERKENGEHINSKDIKKHKNDIYRLTQLLTNEPIPNIPEIAKKDVEEFITKITDDDILLKQIKVEEFTIEEIKKRLSIAY